MGVWPCGAQVRARLGINWKPDSSAKTIWAPIRAAFFLFSASPFASSVQWLSHPAPEPAVLAAVDSIASCASNVPHGHDDTEPRTHAGSLRQCGLWSTNWCDSHVPSLRAIASALNASAGLHPVSVDGQERSVPAMPSGLHAVAHPATA